jgi:hypothetical protein
MSRHYSCHYRLGYICQTYVGTGTIFAKAYQGYPCLHRIHLNTGHARVGMLTALLLPAYCIIERLCNRKHQG